MFAHFRLDPAEHARQRHDEAGPAFGLRSEAHDLGEGHLFGADQIVAVADGGVVVQRADEGLDHIAHPDRLEAGIRAADRQARGEAQQLREAAEQAVAGTGDHRRPEQRPVQ